MRGSGRRLGRGVNENRAVGRAGAGRGERGEQRDGRGDREVSVSGMAWAGAGRWGCVEAAGRGAGRLTCPAPYGAAGRESCALRCVRGIALGV